MVPGLAVGRCLVPALVRIRRWRPGAAHFAEPEVDAAIKRISRLPFEDQPAAWGALDKTIMTDYYPAIVTGYQAEPILHGSRIGGINVDNILGEMPTWEDLHVIQ